MFPLSFVLCEDARSTYVKRKYSTTNSSIMSHMQMKRWNNKLLIIVLIEVVVVILIFFIHILTQL